MRGSIKIKFNVNPAIADFLRNITLNTNYTQVKQKQVTSGGKTLKLVELNTGEMSITQDSLNELEINDVVYDTIMAYEVSVVLDVDISQPEDVYVIGGGYISRMTSYEKTVDGYYFMKKVPGVILR